MESADKELPRIPRWVILAVLLAWFGVLLVTHWGAKSPYSYGMALFGMSAARIDGVVVNPDALTVMHATRFFYDAADVPYGQAHNLRLPIHSFLVAAVNSYARSYLLSNALVNLLAFWLLAYVAVRYADSAGVGRAAILVAAFTCAALPMFPHYAGQPMQYAVGIAFDFVAVIALLALHRDGIRDPLRIGLLTAVIVMTYDWYVYAPAVILWVLFVFRFRRLRDYGTFALAAFGPYLAWIGFLKIVSADKLSTAVRQSYIQPIIAGWLQIVSEPNYQPLTAFLAGHVGIIVSVRMVLGLVYWPLCILAVGWLIATRPQVRGFGDRCLLALFAGVFLIEQLATAAFDWENNPRRALPLVFALCFVYFALVQSAIARRSYRIVLLCAAVLSAFLSLSDAVLKNPVIPYLEMGEAVKDQTKAALGVNWFRLDERHNLPKLMGDEPTIWFDTPRAQVAHPLIFAVSNLYVLALFAAFLWILQERQLLPRMVSIAFALVLLFSLGARFL